MRGAESGAGGDLSPSLHESKAKSSLDLELIVVAAKALELELTAPAGRETIAGRTRPLRETPRLLRASPTLTAAALFFACPAAIGRAAADQPRQIEPQICNATFSGTLDTTGMQPKDFALVRDGTTWHLFYTRQYMTPNYDDNSNTRAIGHAISSDRALGAWTVVDRAAIAARSGHLWDNLHVWAPSIVRQNGTWYMFYAGVEYDTVATQPQLVTTQIQRIGLATSTDLYTWKQDLQPVLFNKKVPWTYQDSTAIGNGGVGWQFRDPEVVPDPDHPGEWLMYYVTIDSMLTKFVIGVATTVGGDLRQWRNVVPITRTSAGFMSADRDESPQVFQRDGAWWLLYMSNHYASNDQITFVLSHGSPSDSAGWSFPDSLKAVTCGEHNYPSTLNLLHAIEHVQAGPSEMLAGFSTWPSGAGIIQFEQLLPPNSTCPTDSLRLGCPTIVTGVAPPAAPLAEPLALAITGANPARSGATFQLSLRRATPVLVAIYDATGRRVKTLFDGELPAGSSAFRWDGRDQGAAPAPSGVYFARATAAGGRAVARLLLAR